MNSQDKAADAIDAATAEAAAEADLVADNKAFADIYRDEINKIAEQNLPQ
jgi:translation elongation factor EF-Ts